MVWAILTGLLGVIATGIGVLAMSHGLARIGLAFFGAGLALMFFAGSLT